MVMAGAVSCTSAHTCTGVQGSGDLTLTTNARNLSGRLKESEFADLPICEFASRCTGYKSNHVWSGLKHLEIHGYVG